MQPQPSHSQSANTPPWFEQILRRCGIDPALFARDFAIASKHKLTLADLAACTNQTFKDVPHETKVRVYRAFRNMMFDDDSYGGRYLAELLRQPEFTRLSRFRR